MTTTLDARNLKCPLPVLRARKAMKEVAAGGLLKVLATDPGAPRDFVHFCRTTGHELVESTESDGIYSVTIRKSA
ncbi:sulfurtransferase TusA family protein [Hypericibacter sp.]|uniref:sulfurtransferase TusA family protein n=1 Tax=Hypericibacter sp. TaxID=2705401 RepID=UPI003D6C89C3